MEDEVGVEEVGGGRGASEREWGAAPSPATEQLTNDVLLLGGESVRLLKVVVKVLDVAAEIPDVAGRRQEAVDAHLAVVSRVQVPRAACKLDLSEQGSDGVDASVARKPVLVSVRAPFHSGGSKQTRSSAHCGIVSVPAIMKCTVLTH